MAGPASPTGYFPVTIAYATTRQFDPLFDEGSPDAWATALKSSLAFIDFNAQSHEAALCAQPANQDTVTIRFAHSMAKALRSTIQFGQAAHVDLIGGNASLVAGVTGLDLSDDIFVEYNRIISGSAFPAAGLSISIAGEGIRRVLAGTAADRVGGFVNVGINS